MTMTVALGSDSFDAIRTHKARIFFRTIDITSYTNQRTITGQAVTFVDGGGGVDTMTRDAGSFVTEGFQTGTIIITGTVSNNATYTITVVAATTLTFATGTVTAEGPIATAVVFAAGTGLQASVGESSAPSVFGLSDIYMLTVDSSENGFVLLWNRTANIFQVHGEATNSAGIVELSEVPDTTDAGTFLITLYGY